MGYLKASRITFPTTMSYTDHGCEGLCATPSARRDHGRALPLSPTVGRYEALGISTAPTGGCRSVGVVATESIIEVTRPILQTAGWSFGYARCRSGPPQNPQTWESETDISGICPMAPRRKISIASFHCGPLVTGTIFPPFSCASACGI
jgi:hypothetical protein